MELIVTLKEMRAKKPSDLIVMENNLRLEIGTTSIKAKLGQISDSSKRRQLRKDVARILTIRRQKQMEAASKEKKS